MRAVLDCNVLVSALLSREGSPAQILRRWTAGEFELVVSSKLLVEFERVLAYPKIEQRLEIERAHEFLGRLDEEARLAIDPGERVFGAAPVEDPDDEYLVRLAVAEAAVIVSGDRHLTAIAPEFPVYTPPGFIELLDSESVPSQ